MDSHRLMFFVLVWIADIPQRSIDWRLQNNACHSITAMPMCWSHECVCVSAASISQPNVLHSSTKSQRSRSYFRKNSLILYSPDRLSCLVATTLPLSWKARPWMNETSSYRSKLPYFFKKRDRQTQCRGSSDTRLRRKPEAIVRLQICQLQARHAAHNAVALTWTLLGQPHLPVPTSIRRWCAWSSAAALCSALVLAGEHPGIV